MNHAHKSQFSKIFHFYFQVKWMNHNEIAGKKVQLIQVQVINCFFNCLNLLAFVLFSWMSSDLRSMQFFFVYLQFSLSLSRHANCLSFSLVFWIRREFDSCHMRQHAVFSQRTNVELQKRKISFHQKLIEINRNVPRNRRRCWWRRINKSCQCLEKQVSMKQGFTVQFID